MDAGLAAAKKLVEAQLGGKAGGSGGSGGGSSGGNKNAGPGEGKDVVELTDANFKKKVLNSEKVMIKYLYK